MPACAGEAQGVDLHPDAPRGVGTNGVAGPTSISIFLSLVLDGMVLEYATWMWSPTAMKQTGAGTGRVTPPVVQLGGSGSGTDFRAISLVSRTEDRHQSAAHVP